MEEVHEGGCLCGALRYRADGKPVRTNGCHCQQCQRLTGSAFLVNVLFLKQQVSIISGNPTVYDHRGAHGRYLHFHFCKDCSTKIGLTLERYPDFFGIFGGTLDDPKAFQITRHIFTDNALPWVTFPPDVDCYSSHAVTEDNMPEVPWQRARSV